MGSVYFFDGTDVKCDNIERNPDVLTYFLLYNELIQWSNLAKKWTNERCLWEYCIEKEPRIWLFYHMFILFYIQIDANYVRYMGGRTSDRRLVGLPCSTLNCHLGIQITYNIQHFKISGQIVPHSTLLVLGEVRLISIRLGLIRLD